MKIFFLLFAFCLSTYAYTQTTREEVVERHEDGSKKKVITYSGVGNSEKILKITEYHSTGMYSKEGFFVSPYSIKIYGTKIVNGYAYWGVVKSQSFKAGDALEDETVLSP
jgi:hypothetical protein